ncbi:MAG: undecaprenyl diphosphate synthase [Chloroflexi bacterium]|nr:undecaprenyl diphosphate synthase [Chloroflexota bacterium]
MLQSSNLRPVLPPTTDVPTHVAIIMDGNGRWAAERGLPRSLGHRAGTESVRGIIKTCVDCGIKVLTLYAFSTENWQRPYDEVEALFAILSDVIDRETDELRQGGVRIRHLGTLNGVPPSLAERIRKAVETTVGNDRLIVNVAFNYGAREEIVRAIRRVVQSGLACNEIDEQVISANLDSAGLPDPDLIIRTAGEMRLSNFLLWQAAYAEIWCTDVYWPDFDAAAFRQAIDDYGRRQRRFGGLSSGKRANGV